MDYNTPLTVLPMAPDQLAICHEEGFISHVLTATDAAGVHALDGLRALRAVEPAEPGWQLPDDAMRVSVGASMPTDARPDIHFYSTAWGRDIISGRALARVSVRGEDELPGTLDDFLALTDGGMVGLEAADVRTVLEQTDSRSGRYLRLPFDMPGELPRLIEPYRGAACVLASIRMPRLRVADPPGFEALFEVDVAFEATPAVLSNAAPSRVDAAHLGLFVWGGTAVR